jgi:hypothetical protein
MAPPLADAAKPRQLNAASAQVIENRSNRSYNAARIRQIRLLRILQAPAGWLFWLIEQRIGRLQDAITANCGG